MARHLIVRLLQFAPTFLVVTAVTFVLLQLAPGDPIALQGEALDGHAVSRQSLEAWRHLRGVDAPLWRQYTAWLGSMLTFDFGSSFVDERPVRELIVEALPVTLMLTATALLLTYLAAVPLGVFSAVKRGSRADKMVSTVLFLFYSMPPFWVALVLLVLLGGGPFLNVLPVRGLASEGMESAGLWARLLDHAWHLVLPVFCLTYPALARTSRFQRAAMLEVLQQDYVRTARAKGLPERVVILKHALKAALLPIVTLVSVDLPWLVGGSVVIERIFSIRGMGMLTFDAILRRDYPLIMGVTACVAVVTMGAVLLSDLVYSWLDPRIRDRGVAR